MAAKSVVPVYPYTSDAPNNNKPDDSAPRTKYFIPASVDLTLSRRNDATTYSAKDCSSNPMYNDIKLPADTIIIIPTAANAIKMGYSNFNNPRRVMYSCDMIKTAAADSKIVTLAKRAKPSFTNIPLKAVVFPVIPDTQRPTTKNRPAVTHVKIGANLSWRVYTATNKATIA